MDNDSIIAVAEDLDYLRRWGPDISDADIRRGSAVLRRLLVEDAYGAAWRATGRLKQPKLTATDLSYVIGDIRQQDVVFALAAGTNFRGLDIAGMLLQRDHPGTSSMPNSVCGSDNSGEQQYTLSTFVRAPTGLQGNHPGEREFVLSEYLHSPSGMVDGREFTRAEVIKYIANIKGGVHLNQRQRKAEAKLIARMAKIEKKMRVHTTDGLLVEIVAIAQSLARSSDAQWLVNEVLGRDRTTRSDG